jgi:hypothetical protein
LYHNWNHLQGRCRSWWSEKIGTKKWIQVDEKEIQPAQMLLKQVLIRIDGVLVGNNTMLSQNKIRILRKKKRKINLRIKKTDDNKTVLAHHNCRHYLQATI